MSSTAMRNRVAFGSIVLVGALGLTACNSSDTTVTSSSSTSTSSSSSTQPSTSSETSSSSSESSTSSQTSSSSSTTSESPSSSATSGSTAETPKGTTMKFNEPAVIEESGDTFRLTVKELQVAPDSVYSEKNLDKSKGTVYYVKYDISPIVAKGSFTSTSVNGLWLYPSFKQGQTAKRMYGSTDDCKSSYDKLSVGQTGSGCYIYQISGETSKTVTYANYDHRITWE